MSVPVDGFERQEGLPTVPGPVTVPRPRPGGPAGGSGSEPGAGSRARDRGPHVETDPDAGAIPGRPGGNWGGNATLLTVVTVILSLGNYSYSFIVVHLLGAREFARFSAAQGLLLVIGSGVMAAIPWAMARFISQRPDRSARREAMHFGILASTLQGLVFGAVAGAVLWSTAGPAVGAIEAVSAFAGSVIAVPVGFLQGLDRIRTITALRVLEFLVRYGTGLIILVVVQRSASAALISYPIGAAALIIAGLYVSRSGLPPLSGEQSTIRNLARQSLGLGAIQVFLAMLGALDTVAALAAHLGAERTASYQSAALLGRIPLFMSAAIGLAAYVHVVNARTDVEVREKMGQAARLYSVVAIPFLIACLTVPDSLLHLLIPARYVDATALLRFTAVSGVAVGWIDVVSTAHQARGAFRPAIRILGLAALAQPLVLICAGRMGGIWWFAGALIAVSLVAAVALSFDARAWLAPHLSARALALSLAALITAVLLHGIAPAWIGLIAVLGVCTLRALQREIRTPPETTDPVVIEDHSWPQLPPPTSMLEFEPDPPAPAPPPPAPRVLIVGDSWIAGLAVAPGKSFAHLVAAELGAEQVLDLSGVSKTTGQAVTQDADRIRAFAPTLAIICCGGTEALVHPGPLVRDALDRWGPPSWKGITGLEPRARYSTSVSRRVRQRSATLLKIVAKRAIIFLTGGKRRMPLAEWRRDLDALIALLAEVGCAMAFIGMWRVDDRMFPGTQAALDETHAELVEAVAGRDDAVLVHIREHLHYFDDFLKDNLHLTVDGHRRVAGLVLAGCRQLTEG